MGHSPELHKHKHVHDDEGAHRHPHHHSHDESGAHRHTHTLKFERYTYLISPVHAIDPRFKIIAALLIVMGVVAGQPLRPLEFAFVVIVFAAVTLLSRIPLRWAFSRSLVVLPVALGIAVFAPLGHADSLSASAISSAYSEYSWLIWSIISKAWVSAYVMLLVSSTTPMPKLLKGLKALKMPDVFVTMLTFLYRFTDVFADQLRSMRHAVGSRAPELGGWRLIRLYGNLAGNLFIRAYERGERIYAAMVSRGYTGVLPTAEELTSRPTDWLVVITAALMVAAVMLY